MKLRIQLLTKTFAISLASLLLASQAFSQDLVESSHPDMDEVIDGYLLQGTPLEGVLDSLAMLTGRAVLRPQALPTPQITFDPGGPITRGELVLAIESLLSLNGIGVSPLGDRFLKVVPLNNISREAPELVTESLDGRDPSGQVVSKLFRLQYLDSQTFQQQIQPFLSLNSIIPFENSNAVIVTDTISNLKRLEYVVSQVDKPSRLNIETVFYTLQYAEASEVAQKVQGMIDDARNRFGEQNNARNRPGARGAAGNVTSDMPPPPEATAGAEGALSLQVLFGSNTAITSDDRTNQLIIMTEPGNLQFFEDIIAKLDVKADPSTRIEVIPLKHADAAEVASLLSQFVAGKTGAGTTTGRESRRERGDRNMPGSPTFPNQQTAPEPAVSRENIVAAAASTLEDRDSQFSTFMTIIADERSNALVISGTRGDLELMGSLVERIDVLLPQVRIEVIIAEVNLSKNVARGMDAFSLAYDEQDDGSGNVSIPARASAEGVSQGVNFLGLGLGGTFNYNDGVISDLTLDVVFNKARERDDVTLLSIPTLVTTHNKEAQIIVAEARPIVTSAQTTFSDSLRTSIQYQDIGIDLLVTPLIGPNDVIQLEIDQKFDDVIGNVVIGENTQPIIGRRQATSYVSVANGELIVLGGLQRSRVQETESKAAILGDLPLLGKLFTRKTDDNVKTELLVFIRPKIMRTTDEARENAEGTLRSTEAENSIERYLREERLEADVPDPEERERKEAEAEKENTIDEAEEEAIEEETGTQSKPKGFRKR